MDVANDRTTRPLRQLLRQRVGGPLSLHHSVMAYEQRTWQCTGADRPTIHGWVAGEMSRTLMVSPDRET
ncbi:MAG TPA: hypothetical protein VGR08_02910 [Thermomicrobiales bacterium]|nr:hypothetical protein [Thermomicrobiales bacterium]